MATISGTWRFNDTIVHEVEYQRYDAKFVANGKLYDWMLFTHDGAEEKISYGPSTDYPLDGDGAYVLNSWETGYQVVSFGASQYIDDSLYNFVMLNAVQQEDTAFEIEVSSNGTKTLKTKGKYCDRDIHVNVRVQPPYIIPAGTYKAGNILNFDFSHPLSYTSNGINYTKMMMSYWPETTGNQEDPNAVVAAVWILSYNAANVYKFWPKNDAGEWADEAYKTITISVQQEVDSSFFYWFTHSFTATAVPETVPEYDGTVTIA